MEKTIKQNDLVSCGPAVAAMICGTTIEDAIKEMEARPNGGYDSIEIHKYCFKRGFVLGGCCYAANEVKYLPIESDGTITFTFTFKGQAFLVGVESERLPGKQHWIYWCGEHVHDPNPTVDDTKRNLSSYDVVDIAPVNTIKEMRT